MEVSGFKRLTVALLLLFLNLMLSKLLELSTSLIFLVVIVNSLYVVIFIVGVIVGFLGNVLVVAAEIATLVIVYLVKLNIGPNISLLTYVVLPYLLGVITGSSFLKRFYLTQLKISVGLRSLSNFLMIAGSSFIATYFIYYMPIINELLLSSKSLTGLNYYLVVCGLIFNSFIASPPTQLKLNALKSSLTYVLLITVISLSWISTPSVILINFNYLGFGEDYLILGRVIRKLDGRKKPRYLFGKYVKIPITAKDNKHLVIVGMSGSGKSYLAMKIVRQLFGKLPVLVVDPHGEYVELAKELNGKVLTPIESMVNPLDTLGKPKNVRAEEVSDMIRRVFKLGNIQKYSLYTLILSTYERLGDNLTPTFNDVYLTLTHYLEGNSNSGEIHLSKEVLNSLIPYLDLLRGSYLTSTTVRFEDLLNGLSVIDLSVVESESLTCIYVESLFYLLGIYAKTYSKPLFVVVDEAHRFMGGKNAPLLSKLVMEGRKFGLSLIVITQQPLDLEASIIANSACIISFTIQELNNLNYISKVLCSSGVRYEVVRDLVANLKKHEALVRIRDEEVLYIIKA